MGYRWMRVFFLLFFSLCCCWACLCDHQAEKKRAKYVNKEDVNTYGHAGRAKQGQIAM